MVFDQIDLPNHDRGTEPNPEAPRDGLFAALHRIKLSRSTRAGLMRFARWRMRRCS